jgi:5-methylcytosine-specific restriction protein A
MPHKGYAGSTRRGTLPADWAWRRSQVAERASQRCEWPGWASGRAHMLLGERCGRQGNECDHIEERWNHAFSNLQWLCAEHHSQKTLEDTRTRVVRERRPPERHPGLRG